MVASSFFFSDFRARLYATVDGQPANALPRDENGAALVLTSADPTEDYLSDEWIARNASPGLLVSKWNPIGMETRPLSASEKARAMRNSK